MKLTTIAIAAALAAGCTVPNGERSSLVATKVIRATGTTECTYAPGTDELVFGTFDPAAGYVHAVVVINRLPDNSGIAPGRLNTNDFQVEGATITTDVLVGRAQSIAKQTVPANGFIPSGGSPLPVGLQLAQPGAILPGSDVRFHIQIFGTLVDGTTVKTNTYEYAAHAITSPRIGAICPTGKVAVPCETGDSTGTTATQDTGFLCL